MLWNVTLPVLFFLISCSDCGKASAKRGGRQDPGKLVATLCHYYSDGAMGCKECFEVARSHRSNHNSTLLPPCKSVQGIKRRNWTLDDGIVTNAVIDTNATKRLTIASCAFYANKTFTCVATRPQCENLTQIECANNTSWSSRYEGSIAEGFRCVGPHGSKFNTKFTTVKTSTTLSSTTPSTANSSFNSTTSRPTISRALLNNSSSTPTPSSSSSASSSSPADRHSTMATMTYGQVSDSSNEIHKIPILEITTLATTRESKPPLTLDYAPTAMTPNKPFTLTSRVTTTQKVGDGSATTTEYTENCTETSCTIFAETAQPNMTATGPGNWSGNQTGNQTLPLLRSINSNSSSPINETSSETLVTLSPLASSTRQLNQTVMAQEELVTLTSHLHDQTSSSSTKRSTTTTTATTLALLQHTLDMNRTMGTVKPEPRNRHPIRRIMY